MILKLAFRNVISKKSSYVIILFMAFAVCLFCVSNAIFDSTENGIQNTFVQSFTGEVMIRPKSNSQISLFGDETPLTGQLTKLHSLESYAEVIDVVSNSKEINSSISQVTGTAALEFNGKREAIYLFGVHSSNYFDLMSSVKIVQGECYKKGSKSVMLSEFMAKKMGAGVGDEVQFELADGPYFRIRKATVTGIYAYQNDNSIFEKFIIVDPDTLRNLLDISENQVVAEESIEEEKSFLLEDDLDFDSLFDDFSDSFTEETQIDESVFFEPSEEIVINEESEYFESSVWNFIICRLEPGIKTKKVIKNLNKQFKQKNLNVMAVDWRHAAGSTALYLYWIRLIFNIGIVIVLFAGFIIVNNTLVINVLDRTREIGTLRAVGAKKRFISVQCMTETFMMTLTSGVIGILLGIFVSYLITRANIQFNNSFLIQLFGAQSLVVKVTFFNIIKLIGLVILLGVLGWIYPVITALKVNPVKAMQGAK